MYNPFGASDAFLWLSCECFPAEQCQLADGRRRVRITYQLQLVLRSVLSAILTLSVRPSDDAILRPPEFCQLVAYKATAQLHPLSDVTLLK